MSRSLEVDVEHWPIAGGFAISRGTKTEAVVVVATIRDGSSTGRGESVPYPHYGESVSSVAETVRAMRQPIEHGLDRRMLQGSMAPGAARCALDCALWDLEAKRSGTSAAAAAGLAPPRAVETAFTIGLGAPDVMERAARAAADAGRTTIKVKLGAAGDRERIAAVRRGAPHSRLIADANEGWTPADYDANLRACRAAGVALIEQPLPAGDDALLADGPHPIPICADESLHITDDLDVVSRRYDAVNIKLDKAGGLTEALALSAAARAKGMAVMVGCMVSTSLAMAPAFLLAQAADFVDLDGPLLLARDRASGIRYDGGTMFPPDPALWG